MSPNTPGMYTRIWNAIIFIFLFLRVYSIIIVLCTAYVWCRRLLFKLNVFEHSGNVHLNFTSLFTLFLFFTSSIIFRISNILDCTFCLRVAIRNSRFSSIIFSDCFCVSLQFTSSCSWPSNPSFFFCLLGTSVKTSPLSESSAKTIPSDVKSE